MPRVALTCWLLLLSCGQADPSTWTRPEHCEPVTPERARDECRAAVAPEVFRQDLGAGERWVAGIGDLLIRDYAWLSVTREVDLRGKRYCDRIETPELQERCNTLVSRPHLLQQLQKGPPPKGKRPGPEGPQAPH